MGIKLKKIKKLHIHREGTQTLFLSAFLIVVVAVTLYCVFDTKVPFYLFVLGFGAAYCIILNFFRCPIRYFNGDTKNIVVAPADGNIVAIEEVEEKKYFHDKRLMVSIFMSLWNVHANWFPVEGKVIEVRHQNGKWHKAWLPKASEENERADCLIETPEGKQVLCRQIAGAMARRIVTYAKPDEDCFIDEHLGFIKFGSRVDVFLPIDTEICVRMGQSTTGNQTIIAKLK